MIIIILRYKMQADIRQVFHGFNKNNIFVFQFEIIMLWWNKFMSGALLFM